MNAPHPSPMLAVTMGDPAGIGPEVILKAATVADVRAEADLVVFGDPLVLERAAHDASVEVEIIVVDDVEASRLHQAVGQVPVVAMSRLEHVPWGHPTRESDRAQVAYIKEATQAVLARRADALVTAPVSKAAFSRAGVSWAGHTEMLAELCSVDEPVMMLVGPTLKVVPLTRHVALSNVPSLIDSDLIMRAVEVIDDAFRRHFGRRQPRIAVAGLNPHAGEGGMFGREDEEIIAPAVRSAARRGIHATGPHPPDAIFRRAADGEFDVVIGMYHDQALIPMKLLDFDAGVNVTLGLPIVRTSVDHGTAYDIAGQGVASAHSMIAAMRLARSMVVEAGKSGIETAKTQIRTEDTVIEAKERPEGAPKAQDPRPHRDPAPHPHPHRDPDPDPDPDRGRGLGPDPGRRS